MVLKGHGGILSLELLYLWVQKRHNNQLLQSFVIYRFMRLTTDRVQIKIVGHDGVV